MNKATVKGSYTVEAALVFPIVLFVIIGLIYLGFYMHDKVKIQSVIDHALLKGNGLVRNETDITTGLIDYEVYNKRGIFYSLTHDNKEEQEQIKYYIQKELMRGLFIARIQSIEVTVTNTDIQVNAMAGVTIPFFFVRQYFTGSGLSLQVKRSIELYNAVEFIRIFDVFAGVASKVEIIKQTIIHLQSVLHKIHN